LKKQLELHKLKPSATDKVFLPFPRTVFLSWNFLFAPIFTRDDGQRFVNSHFWGDSARLKF
jgi:hypothetical protein